MPNTEDVLAANEALRGDIERHGEKVDNLTARIEKAENRGDRTRLIAYLLVVGLMLAGFALLYERSTDNREMIKLQAEVNIASCERSNLTRTAQRQQWRDVRQLLQAFPDKRTRVLAEQLVINADKNFPALDCAPLQQGKPPVPAVPTPSGGPK